MIEDSPSVNTDSARKLERISIAVELDDGLSNTLMESPKKKTSNFHNRGLLDKNQLEYASRDFNSTVSFGGPLAIAGFELQTSMIWGMVVAGIHHPCNAPFVCRQLTLQSLNSPIENLLFVE